MRTLGSGTPAAPKSEPDPGPAWEAHAGRLARARRARARADDPSPGRQRCTDTGKRRLLFAYSERSGTELDRRVFEAHLLACDACFEDLLAVWRMSSLLAEWESEDHSAAGALPQLIRLEKRLRMRRMLGVALAAAAAGCAVGVFL